MIEPEASVTPGEELRCGDRFDDDRPAGSVVGSIGPDGAARLGRDVEGLIAIDNGALRLQPLRRSGWGREGIAYGPFAREPGLALAVHVLNGHNSSQTFHHPESPREVVRRLLRDARRGRFGKEHHYENLAVGFLPAATPRDPLTGGHGFVMHAATADNGELWVGHRGRPARAVLGVLNVPFVFVVLLRPQGAAYYASTIPDATGGATYPMMQPLGIDVDSPAGPLFAAVQQRILGEVGYRVDTRVYGVRVASIDRWSSWYGTAHAADRLESGRPVVGSTAETGQTWREAGATSVGGGSDPDRHAAQIATGRAVGLLHLTVEAGGRPGAVELAWRLGADGSGVALRLDDEGASLLVRSADGGRHRVAADASMALGTRTMHALEVLDDGREVTVRLDGRLLGEDWWEVPPGGPSPGSSGAPVDDGTGLVEVAVAGGASVRSVEAHPREVPLADSLDCGAPWTPPASAPHLEERFDLVAEDLHGSTTPSGGREWRRDEGEGRIALLGDAARVRADPAHPNPGRTVFTVAWDDPSYADVALDMTMPGTARGEGHDGRCGVVLWQDPDNYLVVNLFVDDAFDGASVSTFYHLDGQENMYDAVWTLVRGVHFGQPCRLRVAFDGHRFLADVNDEPALVRSLTDVYPDAKDLRIERVGIIVNREWGDDTGSVLHRFTARARA